MDIGKGKSRRVSAGVGGFGQRRILRRQTKCACPLGQEQRETPGRWTAGHLQSWPQVCGSHASSTNVVNYGLPVTSSSMGFKFLLLFWIWIKDILTGLDSFLTRLLHRNFKTILNIPRKIPLLTKDAPSANKWLCYHS